jgi:hypothetical protein
MGCGKKKLRNTPLVNNPVYLYQKTEDQKLKKETEGNIFSQKPVKICFVNRLPSSIEVPM